MTFSRAVLTVLLVAGATLVVGAAPAFASCHHFTVSAQPSAVAEGAKVTVTVTRDAAEAGSSVRLRTVPGSAGAADFTPIDQRITFTGAQVSKSLTLSTAKDSIAEATERLSLHLSDGQGCSGQTLSYGPDAVVTIQNVASTTTTTTASTTTTSSTTTSSTSSTTSSTTTSSTTTSTTAPSTSSSSTTEAPEDSPDTTEAAAGDGLREEGGGSWVLPIALGGVLVVAFGGALFARRRLVEDELDDVDYDAEEDE